MLSNELAEISQKEGNLRWSIQKYQMERQRTVWQMIVGTPEKSEVIGDTEFDGMKEAAVFPGDLPDDPQAALDGRMENKLKFVKFRPPLLKDGTFPHIRLDKAVEFLLGDRLQ